MTFNLSKKHLLGFLSVGFVIFAIFFLISKKPPLAKVISVKPLPEAVNVALLPQGEVVFSRKIDPEDLSIKITPQVELSLTWEVLGKKVLFTPKEMLVPQTYYYFLVEGKGIEEFSWRFKTGKEEEVKKIIEEGGRGDPSFAEFFEEYERRNPLAQYMPAWGKNFKIVQVAENHFEVTLFGKTTEENEEAKRQALDWFRRHGVATSSLKIDFKKLR